MTEITKEDTIEMKRSDRQDWYRAERLLELSNKWEYFVILSRRAKE